MLTLPETTGLEVLEKWRGKFWHASSVFAYFKDGVSVLASRKKMGFMVDLCVSSMDCFGLANRPTTIHQSLSDV